MDLNIIKEHLEKVVDPTLKKTLKDTEGIKHLNFDEETGIAATHNRAVATPADLASAWYVPSYYEMKLLYEVLGRVNNKMTGSKIVTDGYYMISTMQLVGKYNDSYAYPFSMNTGTTVSVSDPKVQNCRVRLVLAF